MFTSTYYIRRYIKYYCQSSSKETRQDLLFYIILILLCTEDANAHTYVVIVVGLCRRSELDVNQSCFVVAPGDVLCLAVCRENILLYRYRIIPAANIHLSTTFSLLSLSLSLIFLIFRFTAMTSPLFLRVHIVTSQNPKPKQSIFFFLNNDKNFGIWVYDGADFGTISFNCLYKYVLCNMFNK